MSEKSIWPETEFKCNGGGGCVVVEHIAGAVVIRDSKNPYQPGLVFSRKEYADFRRCVRDGSWPRPLLRLAKTALLYLFNSSWPLLRLVKTAQSYLFS